jgi:signal transduction histidine kinase
MIIFISFILTKFNLEQNKTLNRALRVESVLRKERKGLEATLEEKTKEIKHMQMEEISKMYHLIEFGKLSSGLYHDLITPIQTMNLYIEKLSEEHLINDSKFSKVVLNIKNTHEKLSSMLQNIRKQISLNIHDEEFDMVTETKDLINLLKNDYFKHGVEIVLHAEGTQSHVLHTKKAIVNHIVLNLISNAYEACLQDMDMNQKDSYTVNVSLGRHLGKYYISVTDNGIGIKHENLKNIFSNFYTTKTEQKEKQNCGIGLSSAKYYAEKYLGGNIFACSLHGTAYSHQINHEYIRQPKCCIFLRAELPLVFRC